MNDAVGGIFSILLSMFVLFVLLIITLVFALIRAVTLFYKHILAVVLVALALLYLTGCATVYAPEQAAFACDSKLKKYERRSNSELLKVECKE